jgi:hypothetical protein
VAHHAISQLFDDPGPEDQIYCYAIQEHERSQAVEGPARLAVGRLEASSLITREKYRAVYGVVHLGGYDFHCSVASEDRIEDFEQLKTTLFEQFEHEGLTEVIRTLDTVFGLHYYTLQDLFLERRRKVLEMLTEQVVGKFDSTYRALYEENRRLMTYLQEVNAPLVPGFREAAAYTLERETLIMVEQVEAPNAQEMLEALLSEANRWGVSLATDAATRRLEEALDQAMEQWEKVPPGSEPEASLPHVERLERLLVLAKRLGIRPRIWSIQNRFYRRAHGLMPSLMEKAHRQDLEAKHLLDAMLRLGERLNFTRGALPS